MRQIVAPGWLGGVHCRRPAACRPENFLTGVMILYTYRLGKKGRPAPTAIAGSTIVIYAVYARITIQLIF
ncbi:MAG: hypothetical protein AB1461_11315 [Thermodesulfobacteriota bacterium]